jgi:hypothetical protein
VVLFCLIKNIGLVSVLVGGIFSYHIWKKYKDKKYLTYFLFFIWAILELLWSFFSKYIFHLSHKSFLINHYSLQIFRVAFVIFFGWFFVKDLIGDKFSKK